MDRVLLMDCDCCLFFSYAVAVNFDSSHHLAHPYFQHVWKIVLSHVCEQVPRGR